MQVYVPVSLGRSRGLSVERNGRSNSDLKNSLRRVFVELCSDSPWDRLIDASLVIPIAECPNPQRIQPGMASSRSI